VFHILAAELAIIGLGRRVLRMLVDDEESEESRRELAHRLIGLYRREVVPEHGVFIATCVVPRYKFQVFVLFRDFTSLVTAVSDHGPCSPR
jgi:hypothetical protein